MKTDMALDIFWDLDFGQFSINLSLHVVTSSEAAPRAEEISVTRANTYTIEEG